MGMQLWDFVAAHGALELPAIFIAAGAGLEIARGMLFPGMLTRKESLRQAGSVAVKLLLGTLPLLVVAGVVESYVSPVNIPTPLKFLLSGVLFTALVLYLSSGMRRPAPQED
jgi:uncharacterized membrane protein SpoIIM required for sporulation